MEQFIPQQPPDTPVITGPSVGMVDEELTYCIDQIIDPEGDDILVIWDWDDGTPLDWEGPYPSGTEVCKNHTWTEPGTYQIKAKLKDINEAESEWGTFTVTIYSQQPPEKPIITGPTQGVPGTEYTYCILEVVDPEGDEIYVLWGWDDGTQTTWEGPYPSGSEICETHTWTEEGTYTVNAKLKDINEAESEWGTLEVSIPRARTSYRNFVIWLFEHFQNMQTILIKIFEI